MNLSYLTYQFQQPMPKLWIRTCMIFLSNRKMLRFSIVYLLWLFYFLSEISCLVKKFEKNSELLVSELVGGFREQIISKLLFSEGVIKQGLTPNVVFILACTRFGWKHSQSFAISSCKQYLWQLWNQFEFLAQLILPI